MKNYYAILEVPVGSPVAEIREAYRRLVQENLWNKETFAELKEAYEILTTPARRNEYDKATFGETFSSGEATTVTATSDSSLRENARHCPMGAASQCPVINARVPLQETYCPECGFLLSSLSQQEFEPVTVPNPNSQIRLEDASGRVYTLRPGLNSVGREGTDVLLPEKTVSRRHAQIEIGADGGVAVEDLGSTNGTRVKGETLAPGATRSLLDGEPVQFGSIELHLRLPDPAGDSGEGDNASRSGGEEKTREFAASPVSEEAGPSPARAQLVAVRGNTLRSIPLVPGVTTFGRRAENTVVLREDPYVSGSHAQIIAEDDVFRLTDLGSTNGTLVNGELQAANQPRVLVVGDEIVIGGTAYLFEQLEQEQQSSLDGSEDEVPVAEGDAATEETTVEPHDLPASE